MICSSRSIPHLCSVKGGRGHSQVPGSLVLSRRKYNKSVTIYKVQQSNYFSSVYTSKILRLVSLAQDDIMIVLWMCDSLAFSLRNYIPPIFQKFHILFRIIHPHSICHKYLHQFAVAFDRADFCWNLAVIWVCPCHRHFTGFQFQL